MTKLVLPHQSLVLVAGVPGSGKSHLLSNTKFTSRLGVFTLSADDVRGDVQEFYGFDHDDYIEECIEEAREDFFNELHEAWSASENIVVEAAYLTRHSRTEMVSWAQARNYTTHLILVTATWEECVRGVSERGRSVPLDVLSSYWSNYEMFLAQLEAGRLDAKMASAHITSRTDTFDEIIFGDVF